jgi:putative hydrolase of the HAD superfamily
MINRQQIKAIGFDVDGTLYIYSSETTIIISQIVAKKAAELLGRPYDVFEEEYLAAREKYRSNTLALNSFGLNGQSVFQSVLDQFPIDQHVGRDQKLIKLIAKLKQRYRLFIISNGVERQVIRKLETLGLTMADFDPTIYAYDHGWAKPEPAPFLAAIEALKLPPEQIVYVGDREDADIAGAQAVGMQAIYVGGKSEIAQASVQEVYDIGLLLLPA